MSEQELIEGCIKNSKESQQKLYQMYSKTIFNTCLRMVKNTERAEEVLQDIFISVFKNIAKFRRESSLYTWINRIAINHCLNDLRKKRQQNIPLDSSEAIKQIKEKAEIEEDNWQLEKIKKGMEQLPEGYRMILSLYAFEGFSHIEIAKKLNISVVTSRTQYHRAKKKLKALCQ